MQFLPYKGKKLLKGSVRETKTLMNILLVSQMKDVGCRTVLENAVIYLFIQRGFPLLAEQKTDDFFSIQISEIIINEVIFLLCKAAVR